MTMVFIKEKIDTPELQAELDSLRLVSPVTRVPPYEGRWLVDREHGLYFVEFGGGGPEIPFVFGLADKNGLILEAQARDQSTGERHMKNLEVTWNVSTILIRERYAGQVDELLSRLRDAFAGYGSLGNLEVVKKVTVNLPVPKFV